MEKKELLIGCTSSIAYDPKKAVGVPTISIPTRHKVVAGANFHVDLGLQVPSRAEQQNKLAKMVRETFLRSGVEFFVVHGEMTADEREALFPPSPFNRFFKTE